MVQISEVKGNNARDSRTAAHTHIKGLGLRPDGIAERQSGGFVGQVAAREVSVCANIPTEVTDFFLLGLWSSCRPYPSTKDGWQSYITGWRTWDWKDCPRHGH